MIRRVYPKVPGIVFWRADLLYYRIPPLHGCILDPLGMHRYLAKDWRDGLKYLRSEFFSKAPFVCLAIFAIVRFRV